MGLENVGIGGVLTFNGAQAISGMGSATAASDRLVKSQSLLGGVVSKIGSGFGAMAGISMRLGLALSPVSAGFAFAEKYAADFEKQMSAVKAVAGASSGEMAKLTLAAKQLGAKSSFDPIEVASGMEELARAGFDANETLTAIPGVLAAAAAEGMPLAQATEIVTSTLRGMGLAADQSSRVADVLALASAKTNASIADLGESMKYAAAQSKIMGIDLETTVGILGLASDAGLKGSIGGSSFAAMLTKLAKPSKEANAWLKANNIEMKKTATGGLDIVAVVKEINTALSKQGDVMKKGALLAEIFGDRGKKAFGALTTGIESGKIDTIVDDLRKAKGAAEQMASTRLEGVLGTLKQIWNAAKALTIELVGGLIGDAGPGLKEIGTAFGNIVGIVQQLQAGVATNRQELEAKFGPTVVAIAYGIVDAIKTIRETVARMRVAFEDFFTNVLGQSSPDMIQQMTKWIVILLAVAAAVGPILLALGGLVTFITGTVAPAIEGVGTVILGVAAAASGAGLIVGAVFFAMRSDGEAFGDTMTRMWSVVTDATNYFRDNAVQPLVQMWENRVSPIIEVMQRKWSIFMLDAHAKAQQLFGGVIMAVQFLEPLFHAVFHVIGVIITTWAAGAATAFGWVADAAGVVFGVVKEIGIWLIENVVNALQKVVRLAVKAAGALGLDKNSPMWADLAYFASQPEFHLTDQAGRVAAVNAANNAGKPKVAAERPPEAQDAMLAKDIAGNVAMLKASGAGAPPVNVKVDVEDKRQLDIKNCMTVDGRSLAVAQGRHKQEINERAGFRATPWQRRQIAEQGAAPVGGFGSQ
jgi:TP901 family phage tail tape measure protein